MIFTSECAAVMCVMYCENGFKKDHRGCDICICNGEEDTPKQMEPMEKDFVVSNRCKICLWYIPIGAFFQG